MVQFNFNASGIAPSTGGGDVLETGLYPVQVTSSEIKSTKRGDGYMLVWTYTIIDGPAKGKKIIDRMNIQNQNQQAVEIAQGQLSALSHVTGRLVWDDTQELHGIPFVVSIEKVERDDKPGAFSNNVKGYMDMQGNPPGQSSTAAPTSAPPAAPTAPPAQMTPPAAPVSASPATQPWAAPPAAPATTATPATAAPPWQQGAPAPTPAPTSAAPPWAQG